MAECQIYSTTANCYHRNASSSDASSPVVECQICGKRGHAALDCNHHSNYSFQGQALLTAMMAQSSYSPEQVWIADTCASHHMVGNASHLRNVTSYDVTENFIVGNREDSSLASSQSSAVPSHASASFSGDPVILPPHDSSSASMSPYMHPVQTRSKSGIDNTKPFEDYHCYLTTIPPLYEAAEPATYKAASQEEIEALHTQCTWDLVPLPVDKNIVGSRWVYRVKKNSDGSVARHNAHLVAQGFSQAPGVDFSETFSLLILSIAAMNKWSLRMLFFTVTLKKKCLCDNFKQAPRAWNAKFTSHLRAFIVSHSDPSLFVKHVGSNSVILLLYVDDIILTGYKDSLVQEIIDKLSDVFEMKDMGRLTYFLGLQISYNDNGDIFVCQTKYATDLLAKVRMDTCRPCTTPCKPHCQLLASEGDSLSDPTIYRSIYTTQPSYLPFQLVKRILRYIHGTLDYGLTFTSGSWDLHAYISWQSKKQNSVYRSSTEAEYRALANTAADLAWVQQVLFLMF
ncbi:hypothetical protein Prudu_021967 [Prunus dulcis]|uniref:CCHC-type domain-containing protein n=1 Tax=Prunus dulcis TaxID=3755 RepID=A0A4Y1RZM6_PRUDU|nr:hypothetical protein Prudu_021967 [Prunus dulcis]